MSCKINPSIFHTPISRLNITVAILSAPISLSLSLSLSLPLPLSHLILFWSYSSIYLQLQGPRRQARIQIICLEKILLG